MAKEEKENLRFAVCISNTDYPASLETGKIYRVIPDVEAESLGYIRIIDESGEDYGYSQERFFALDIPVALQEVLAKAA
jgi:hypothetical protein